MSKYDTITLDPDDPGLAGANMAATARQQDAAFQAAMLAAIRSGKEKWPVVHRSSPTECRWVRVANPTSTPPTASSLMNF